MFVPLATLLFGMDKVLFPEEKEDIQYAPIGQMMGNVVKMTISITSAFFSITASLGSDRWSPGQHDLADHDNEHAACEFTVG